MNWGKSIVIAFVFFVGFIATLVTVCMKQDVNLVSKDYYKDELAYQEQITRLNNTGSLAAKPQIRRAGDVLEIRFSEFHKIEKGSVKLFRPSDPRMDRIFNLKPTSESEQLFPIDTFEKGMYRARMQWLMDGKEFYVETVINI